MCGIGGILSLKGHVVEAATLQAMTTVMRHRGPDDVGFHLDGHCGLGICRLSIIDVTGGHQPIFNERGNLAIIFNGEIYNYRELREGLQGQGHRFQTRSDTETILHAYEDWGMECLHQLSGMFAFAIWDSETATLFLARDRLGIKPLYYHINSGFFAFASEVRALLASGLIPRRLSLEGLASYLACGSLQEPQTLIQEVYSILPGHYLVVEDGQVRQGQYWDFPLPAGHDAAGSLQLTEGRVTEEIRALLEEAVQSRLVSEVPLGAFLSSGIDSSAVVALMSRLSTTPVRTFTLGFEEGEFDESTGARVTARRCQTEHQEIIITPSQVLADLPVALAAMDQPTIDGVNTFFISRAAKEAGITVALSGLGGDEVFGGYETFRTLPKMLCFHSAWRFVPDPIKNSTAWLLSRVMPSTDRYRKLASFIAGRAYFRHPYYAARALFTPAQQAQLLNEAASASVNGESPWHRYVEGLLKHAAGYDPVNAVSYLECRNYLVSTLLRDTDCMSMAHSLEVRAPLIDHKLVEYLVRLPGALKVDRRTPKPLLVKALNGMLPPEVVYQPKRTFTFPWAKWLKGALREEVAGVLQDHTDCDILDPQGVEDIWRQFMTGRLSWSRPWSLYVLKKWMRQHLRG